MTGLTVPKHKMNTLVRSCRLFERMNRSNEKSHKSDSIYFNMLGNYFQRICEATEQGKPLALHTVFMPAEILYAMDIIPMHGEMSTWMTATFLGESQALLEKASEMGLATEVCSAHRGLAGAFALNIMARPDVILWSNLICDNTAKSGELIAELTHSPAFFLDHPFSDSENEQAYLVEEFKDMISFLEEHTKHRMNWEKLSEMIERLNYQIELSREICELRKTVPSPFPLYRILEMLNHYYLLPGQSDAVQYLEMLREDLSYCVEQKIGAVPHEKYRLMSLFVPPVQQLGALGKYFERKGAVSVIEPFFSFWGEGKLNPSKPLESLAQKSFMFPEISFYGPFQRKTIEKAIKALRDYKVDGAVFYSHMGCRQAAAVMKFFKDAITEENIPFLALDFDLLDPTVVPQSDLEQKLDQMLEMIDEN